MIYNFNNKRDRQKQIYSQHYFLNDSPDTCHTHTIRGIRDKVSICLDTLSGFTFGSKLIKANVIKNQSFLFLFKFQINLLLTNA